MPDKPSSRRSPIETVTRGAIRFLVTREGRAPIRKLLACVGDQLRVAVDVRLYGPAIGPARPRSQRRFAWLIDGLRRFGQRLRQRRLMGMTRRARSSVFVFADIERLSWDERRRAARLWSDLASSGGVRLLNHPTRSMCRYELLRGLRARGWNDFDVYRASEKRLPTQYPVFLRGEDDHAGAASGLLANEGELISELDRWRSEGALRESTLIVEFCDTSDEQGLFRKYGAFRIGRHILPRHIFVSRGWMLKSTHDSDGVPLEEMARLEQEYMEANPHSDELMERFEFAGIEYGRVDYGIKDGRIQIWEINTNPTVFTPDHFEDVVRLPVHDAFLTRMNQALAELAE